MENRKTKRCTDTLIFLLVVFFGNACSHVPEPPHPSPAARHAFAPSIQKSVVTVITYDVDERVSAIGSGFFISDTGQLVTNHHVLSGAYNARIRTMDGSVYPVSGVISENQLVDLIKVRVDIPPDTISPINRSSQAPAVADRVFVVGSPMGLEQTVSEGIVSAIRELPAGGNVLQLTAPISRGSSGGPVFDRHGDVIGVVTFQAAKGQNLNFAVAIEALDLLVDAPNERSIAEWTIRNSNQGPALAASLCRSGSRLSIQGEYEEALSYFQRAARAAPDDPEVWFGLGSCYAGLDQREDAVAAFRRPIDQNPDNAVAHFVLAMYYKATGQFDLAVTSLKEVIRIDNANVRARFELGRVYGQMDLVNEQINAFETILADHPDHIPALIGLGVVWGQADRFDEAIGLFNHAKRLEPGNALIDYNMGVTFNQMERPDSAIRAYKLAIRSNPRMTAAHFNLGMTYLEQGRRKMALDQYEILKGLDTDAAGRLFDRIYPEP